MGRRFFIHIIMSIALAVVASSAYYYWVCHGLRHAREYTPARLNTALYDTTGYDVAFVGTSRASNLIDPWTFDSVTHLHSYNVGMEGAPFTAIDIFARKFVKKHNPRYIVMNIDIYTMEREYTLFDFPQYYPYMRDTDIAALSKMKEQLDFGKYLPFIAISYIDDRLKGTAFNAFLNRYPAEDLTWPHRGFAPLDSSYVYTGTENEVPVVFNYDTANFKRLDSLCSFFHAHQCEVAFVMAPIYAVHEVKSENANNFYDRLQTIESKYHIREFNHYTDRSFKKELFFNRTHLNIKGALIYSRMLADSFASMYQSKPAN